MVVQKLVDYAKVIMEEAFSRRHEEVAPKPPWLGDGKQAASTSLVKAIDMEEAFCFRIFVHPSP